MGFSPQAYVPELLAALHGWLGGSNTKISVRDPAVPEMGTFAAIVDDPVLILRYITEIADEPWLVEDTRRGFCGASLAENMVLRRSCRKMRFFTEFMKPLVIGDRVTFGIAGKDRLGAFLSINRGLYQPGFD